MRTRALLVALILALTPVPGAAQDFDAGVAAYLSGDYATALREWRPLAEQGDAWAQYNLGIMYDNGFGVAQDYAEAVTWYRLAAAQGNALAQNILGSMYEAGDGVAQDYAEAGKWYRLAAEQGNALAQSNLGSMFANGRGVAQNYVTAHMWFNIAAANGDEGAGEYRDRVAGRMTADAILQAQSRARACMEANYQACD